MTTPAQPSTKQNTLRGLAAALGACLLWGNSALFFKPTEDLPITLTLAMGTVWAAIIFTVFFTLRRRWPAVRQEWRSRRKTLACAFTSTINVASWALFIWAVQNEQAVSASLGYFLGPLMLCLVGVVVLRERLNRWQWLAIGFAALGVAYSFLQAQGLLTIALLIALLFAIQNPVRKIFGLAPVIGIYTEILIALPVALAYIAIVHSAADAALLQIALRPDLILVGFILAVPLMLYVEGARLLPLSTLGLLTYVSPTIQLLIATLILGEPFAIGTLATFTLIWAGLTIYTVDGWRRQTGTAKALTEPTNGL